MSAVNRLLVCAPLGVEALAVRSGLGDGGEVRRTGYGPARAARRAAELRDGAFKTLASNETVKPAQLAGDISFALITTACGLAIAIPLLLATASINVRIRKMEDLVAAGLNHFLESFRMGLDSREPRHK